MLWLSSLALAANPLSLTKIGGLSTGEALRYTLTVAEDGSATWRDTDSGAEATATLPTAELDALIAFLYARRDVGAGAALPMMGIDAPGYQLTLPRGTATSWAVDGPGALRWVHRGIEGVASGLTWTGTTPRWLDPRPLAEAEVGALLQEQLTRLVEANRKALDACVPREPGRTEISFQGSSPGGIERMTLQATPDGVLVPVAAEGVEGDVRSCVEGIVSGLTLPEPPAAEIELFLP